MSEVAIKKQHPDVSLFKGKFIVFEGIDGCGKDTVRARIAEQLTANGVAICVVNDPGSTTISTQLRNILLEPASEGMHSFTELLLYTAARTQLLYNRILPCLEDGICVLCNRWIYATHAYQGAGNGIDAEIINGLHMTMCGGFMPEVAILIDIPVALGLQRREAQGKLDRIESRFKNSDDPTYYDRVRMSYIKQSQRDLFDQNAPSIILINGTKTLYEQVKCISQNLKQALSFGTDVNVDKRLLRRERDVE